MAYTREQLDWIYRCTSGRCHLCQKVLSRKNYNRPGKRGAWHVDHSVPRSNGGTDRLNNLKLACIGCNLDKSNKTTHTAWRWNGKTRASLSPEKRKQAKTESAILGAMGGGAVGFAVGGPVGAVIGALAGGHLAGSANPDR
jgi:5-methylcytosine-specific restriction endonuclease McrA